MLTFALPGKSTFLEDIEYGQAQGVSLCLDAHIPEGPGPFPAVIIVHGGGWVMGDRKHTIAPLFQPLADAGFAWFSISYRLANTANAKTPAEQGLASILTMGTAVDDVRQAIAFVKSHATEYRVDPQRVALVGESAGAQLADMAALKPGPHGEVKAVVALYAPNDLVSLAETSKQIPDAIRQSIRGSPWEGMIRSTLQEISPVTWVKRDAPPFLLIHGTNDTLVPFSQSIEFCDRLRSAGGSCEIFPVRGGGHGLRWWEYEGLTSYKDRMVKWLRKELALPEIRHS